MMLSRPKYNFIACFIVTIIVIIGITNENKKADAHLKESPTLNVLLLGTDSNELDEVKRADALVLLSLNRLKKEASLISIPRDSKVTIPCGKKGSVEDKINHAYSLGDANWKNKGGGKVCTTQSIENLFSLVDLKYIYVDINKLDDIVNKLGGIKVTPKQSFCQTGYDKKTYCVTKNEEVILQGEAFLSFVRHRSTLSNGDLDRTFNQRLALISIFETIKKMPKTRQLELIAYAYTKTKSNLSLVEILGYIKTDTSDYRYKSLMVQGKGEKTNSYYYRLDSKHVATIKEILRGN